jgi:hypothetical protein
VPDRELRRRCEDKLRELYVPQPFELGAFLADLERVRERPVELMPITARPDSPCGLWISMPLADYIFYEQHTEPLHRTHIICHEVGHMLFGHRGRPWDDAIIRLLMPSLDPKLVRSILGRNAYSTEEEREAETLASLLLERAATPPPAPATPVPEHLAAVLSRVESTFGSGRRRGSSR